MANLVKISGRTKFIAGIESVEPVSAGRFLIKNEQGFAFYAIGGRKAGGASNQWFVEQAFVAGARADQAFPGYINATSLVDSARAIAFI